MHVHILMHPKELDVSKNTGKLAALCLKSCTIHLGEKESDFTELKKQLTSQIQQTCILYPSEDATPIEKLSNKSHDIKNLIVLDATWKKAFKMLQLNPWLNQFNKLTFSQTTKSQYTIRKANREDSLSTLEAIALSLESLEQVNTQPLYQCLKAMIDGQLANMPEHVKNRYK